MKKNDILKLVLSALMLALALVLPFLTGQIPEIGGMLLPMHLPVLLCGFVCGWPWGLAVGFVTPLMRSVVFGMPPMLPTALCMTFELAAYGAFAGLMDRKMPVFPALLCAMLLGRAVWGAASYLVYALLMETPFSIGMFWAGGFLNAWPGMVLQLVLVPLVVSALRRAKLIPIK